MIPVTLIIQAFGIAGVVTLLDHAIITKALHNVSRSAPFDLISMPADASERFFDNSGNIRVTFDDLIWTRFDN